MADRQEVRGQFQDHPVLVVGVLEGFGIDVAGGQAPGLDRQAAVRLLLLVPLEDEVAPLARGEVAEFGEPLLHLLEKVEHGISAGGELHLGVQVDVDVELVALGQIPVHPRTPIRGRGPLKDQQRMNRGSEKSIFCRSMFHPRLDDFKF